MGRHQGLGKCAFRAQEDLQTNYNIVRRWQRTGCQDVTGRGFESHVYRNCVQNKATPFSSNTVSTLCKGTIS